MNVVLLVKTKQGYINLGSIDYLLKNNGGGTMELDGHKIHFAGNFVPFSVDGKGYGTFGYGIISIRSSSNSSSEIWVFAKANL